MFSNIRNPSSRVFGDTFSLAKVYILGKEKQFLFQIKFFSVESENTIACLLPVNHILGTFLHVTVLKTYSDIEGKDSNRKNMNSVSAEEIQCTKEGDTRDWGKETRLHGGNAICVERVKMDRQKN